MKRIYKKQFICLVLFIITSIIGMTLFIYDGKVLSSGYIPKGEQKRVDGENDKGSFMLSYGPYHNLKDEYYIIALDYKTDTDYNSYEIYSDTTLTIYEGELAKDATKVTYLIKKPNIKAQVLTFYSGIGTLQIDCVKVIPLKIIVIWFMSLLSILFSVVMKGRVGNIAEKITEIMTSIFVLCIAFYVDDSAAVQDNGKLILLLFLLGIFAMFCLSWEKVGYREEIFALSFTACCITEWKNIVNYNLRYMTWFLSGAIACCIFTICYLFIRNIRKYCIVTSCITITYIIYSAVQHVYYTYFKDFFTVKIIKLLFTAMEASSSIEELIDKDTLSYLGVGIVYVILMVFVKIKFNSKRRIVENRSDR